MNERKRVESLGGYVDDGYLNGQLAVTRALGDWHLEGMKGTGRAGGGGGGGGPLSAEPELKMATLTKDDEFLIIGSDGVWDSFLLEPERRGLGAAAPPGPQRPAAVLQGGRGRGAAAGRQGQPDGGAGRVPPGRASQGPGGPSEQEYGQQGRAEHIGRGASQPPSAPGRRPVRQ